MSDAIYPFAPPPGPHDEALPAGWVGRVFPQVPPSPAPNFYQKDAAEVHTLRIPLDNATIRREYAATGNVFWVIQASSQTALATLHLNRHDADGIPVSLGMAFRTPNFNKIYVDNLAQGGQWLLIMYFVSTYDFFAVNSSIASPSTSLVKPTTGANATIGPIAAGNNAVIVAADATRRQVIVRNDGPGIARIAWDATPPTDLLGIQILQGDSITLEGTAQLDGRAPTGGGAVTLSVITVND